MSADPDHFVDGQPIPPGYLEAVTELINEVCDIEDQMVWWEFEL